MKQHIAPEIDEYEEVVMPRPRGFIAGMYKTRGRPPQKTFADSIAAGARPDEIGFRHGGFVPKAKRPGTSIPPGRIYGPGTGISDSIHGEVPTGSYIMPADSTQSIGADLLRQIGKPRQVAVSNGEFNLAPEQVYMVGLKTLDAMKNATHRPLRASQLPRDYKLGRNFAETGPVLREKTQQELLFGSSDPSQTTATSEALNFPDITRPETLRLKTVTLPGDPLYNNGESAEPTWMKVPGDNKSPAEAQTGQDKKPDSDQPLAKFEADYEKSMQGAGNDPNNRVRTLASDQNAQAKFNALQEKRGNGITASRDLNGQLKLSNVGAESSPDQTSVTNQSGNIWPNIDLAGSNARLARVLGSMRSAAPESGNDGPRGGGIERPGANPLSQFLTPVRLPNGSYGYTTAQLQAVAGQQKDAASNATQLQVQAMHDAAQARQTAETEAGNNFRTAAENQLKQTQLNQNQASTMLQTQRWQMQQNLAKQYQSAKTDEEKKKISEVAKLTASQ